MSLFSDRNQAVFQAAERAWLEPVDEVDVLEGKPEGFCPWDGAKLRTEEIEGEPCTYCPSCLDYDSSQPETVNRERYAMGYF